MSRVNDIKYLGTLDNECAAFDMVQKPGDAVVVSRDSRAVRIIMFCPCGECGQTMMLQVDPPFESRPSWALKVEEDKITLSPSIRRRGHCNAHFWIKEGKVEWC